MRNLIFAILAIISFSCSTYTNTIVKAFKNQSMEPVSASNTITIAKDSAELTEIGHGTVDIDLSWIIYNQADTLFVLDMWRGQGDTASMGFENKLEAINYLFTNHTK